jgi:RNA polymerase sigma-70 factor, ECF subfamily
MDDRACDLEQLYREHGQAVWAYVRRRLANGHAAEETFQETFLAVAADWTGLATASSARAWLIGIARNLVREHLRSAARRAAAPLDEQYAQAAPPSEDPRLEATRRAIARLPDAQRDVLELRLSQDLTYVEIAEVLAIPVGTVRSRLHLAVAALRQWATVAGATGVLKT